MTIQTIDNNTHIIASPGMELVNSVILDFPTGVHSITLGKNDSVWNYTERLEAKEGDMITLKSKSVIVNNNKSNSFVEFFVKLKYTIAKLATKISL